MDQRNHASNINFVTKTIDLLERVIKPLSIYQCSKKAPGLLEENCKIDKFLFFPEYPKETRKPRKHRHYRNRTCIGSSPVLQLIDNITKGIENIELVCHLQLLCVKSHDTVSRVFEVPSFRLVML